jgi:LysR family transcriptional regulator, glycine cleavage system transcriptional activator
VRAISDKVGINRRWLPLNALRAFEAVGHHLSFTGGAAALSVSQSAVSRHVIGLEDLLGKPLFDREATGLVLTSAGEELLPIVSKSLDRIEQTLNAIRDDRQSKRALRIHIPPSMLQQQLLPLLHEFRVEHPDYRIDVSSTNVTGLPANNIDMAIVYDRPNVDDFVTDLLWMVRVAPLCSPDTAKAAAGQSLAQFLSTQELLHIKLEQQPRDLLWSSYARQCALDIDTGEGFAFDTAIAAAQYAMGGTGVTLADIDMFAPEIADGRLVMPFDAVIEEGYGYYLKLHADDLSDPVISLFRSWLIGRFVDMRTARNPAAPG